MNLFRVAVYIVYNTVYNAHNPSSPATGDTVTELQHRLESPQPSTYAPHLSGIFPLILSDHCLSNRSNDHSVCPGHD